MEIGNDKCETKTHKTSVRVILNQDTPEPLPPQKGLRDFCCHCSLTEVRRAELRRICCSARRFSNDECIYERRRSDCSRVSPTSMSFKGGWNSLLVFALRRHTRFSSFHINLFGLAIPLKHCKLFSAQSGYAACRQRSLSTRRMI